METYIFVALNKYSPEDLNNIELYLLETENFYAIVLSGEKELQILFELLKIGSFKTVSLHDNDYFQKALDISDSLLPKLNQDKFDELYAEWLKTTGRESSMDEYGQLIFLQGQFENFNSKKYRLVLHAKS